VLRRIARLAGATLGPFEAFLALRGVRTLSLRVARQNASARWLAERLATHPAIATVHYPGLAAHPDHARAAELFAPGCFGAMVAFELRQGGRPEVLRLLNALRIITPATTLGDVYTTAVYPAMASHRFWSPEERRAAGISDQLVRLSIGLEAPEDLYADLDQALGAAG
jgi:cystathionine gamma-synthase